MRILLVAPEGARAALAAGARAAGLAVVAEHGDPLQTPALARALAPEIAAVALERPDPAALAALEEAAGLGAYVIGLGPELPPPALMGLMRAGVRDYLGGPAELPAALERAVRAFAQPRGTGPLARPAASGEQEPEGPGALSVAVFGPRGGCGQSTLAANLAIALFQVTARQSVLVDLALQYGDLDLLLNVSPVKSSADLLPVLHDLDWRALEQTLTPSPLGVKLLAAPPGLTEAEGVSQAPLARAWEILAGLRTPTVFDAGAELTPVVVGALEQADFILMPIPAELGALRKSVRAVRQFEALGLDLAKLRFAAYEGDPGTLTEADAEAALGAPVHVRLPWVPEEARLAIDQGVPVLQARPQGPYAQALRRLAAELSGMPAPARAKAGRPLPDWLASALGALRRRKSVPLLTAGTP